jgi:hypothetical protein
MRARFGLALGMALAAACDSSGGASASPCHGVCAGAYFGCARTYATTDCLEKVCCELPEDGGPPTIDGGCPTFCASPDDIGCPGTWYRSSDCVSTGVLCCGPHLPGHGTDGG